MARSLQIPPESIIKAVLEAYDQGLTLEALRRAENFAQLKDWAGVSALALAARIATNTGAPGLAARLAARAFRTDRTHPEAQLQYGFAIGERRGSLAVWRAMRKWQTSPLATDEERAELLALQARTAADLRDFATAEKILAQADPLAPNQPWIKLQRSHLLERQDRIEEALEVSRAATALHPFPFYRPGVQISAHLLQLLDRDQDAIELLMNAGRSLQNGAVAAQLFGLLSEHDRWQEAEAALSRFVELSPLLETHYRKWVSAQRARAAYHLGKRVEAISFAREVDDDFHKTFAARLEATPGDAERVQLDVSFVRQHFKTCAPATLAALGRFWQMSAEHLKLAEAMCYDGTPHWQQRQWAEQNSWLVREFRVTHESVVALIGRGIPFAISTVDAASSHMQAVVGYDRTRETILLRDPGQAYTVEAFAASFFKAYRAFGPHGTVFLPKTERTRIDGLELPDTELYDSHHQFWLFLTKHDREGAANILEHMTAAHGETALVWETRLGLATYDANVSEQLRCLDRLLELFPNNPARLLRRLGCLQSASRAERLEFLERICPVKEADPILFIDLARALGEDARRLPEAARWLKRALRFRPYDSNGITVQAELLWMNGSFDEATELYRFAANLESYREHLYRSWFNACRRTRRTDEAMGILEDRFKRFGTLSEQPAMTLAWAWRELDQLLHAREVYAEAARRRPDHGYLLLNAASLESRLHDENETQKFLQLAKDKVRKTDWLRAYAEICETKLDTTASLRTSREILELEPLALDAHGGVARGLAQLEGSAAAVAHLKAACARFPHHYGLRRMLVDWSRGATPEEAEAAARDLVQVDPADAWGRRELAVVLSKANRHEEALQEATMAAQIEPRNSYSFSVIGHIEYRRKQPEIARAQFRQAVELSVDNSDALRALLDLARTDAERKAELAFVESQLIKQVVNGDGLLAFLDLARPVLDPETLLQSLRLAHRERPDLWHAWCALAAQLGHLNRLEEALDIAKQASARFPHLPRIWLDLATVHQWRKDSAAEISAAQHSFDINPGWNRATLALSNALERTGKLEEAKKVYERALNHSGNDAQLHAYYAHLLWRLRQPEAALAEIERALRLAPGSDWAWDLFLGWVTERGEPARAGQFARALTTERPGEMRVWLMLARVLTGPDTMSERLAATDRAIALEPGSIQAWDLKADLLAAAERFDEAVQTTLDGARACTSDVFMLHGRRAWVEARRHRTSEAIRLMREVLKENASYIWGWNQLAHWLVEQNALVDAATALETLQRLRPHDSWVIRQLGFLRLKQDDRAAALKAFATALQISPTDVHAAQNLFELQLRDSNLDGAAETLRIMQLHQPGTRTLTTEIFLRLRKKEKKAAAAILEKLCAATDPDPWPVDAAADAFRRVGEVSTAMKIFRRAVKTGSCNPQVATAAIGLHLKQAEAFTAVGFFLDLKPGELQRRAAAPLVQGLAAANARMIFRWLLWRRKDVLFKDDAAWGQVGYTLSNFNASKRVIAWMADWRSRTAVQPWMLFNLCLSLRQCGRYAEATEVVRYAIQKWGHREGSADLRLFLAVEDALSGSIADTRENLKLVVIRQNNHYDQDLLALATALVEFRQLPASDRAQQFKTIRRKSLNRFDTVRMLNATPDVRHTFRRAARVFVENGGGWRARLWFGWKLHWQWTPAPFLIALAVISFPLSLMLSFLYWIGIYVLKSK